MLADKNVIERWTNTVTIDRIDSTDRTENSGREELVQTDDRGFLSVGLADQPFPWNDASRHFPAFISQWVVIPSIEEMGIEFEGILSR
jgi:hypothetical protein